MASTGIEKLIRLPKLQIDPKDRSYESTASDIKSRHIIPYGDSRDVVKNEALYKAKVRIMCSMIPDEIILTGNDYSPKNFECAVLFADVSGFTDLSEKYAQIGIGGASNLSEVLNTYIGNMVQEILSHGGDVFKFSGDAFLVLFKVNPIISMQEAVHEAIDTALIIQKNYGSYETDLGVTLRVKIAVSSGQVFFSLVGTEELSHYIVIGQSIWDVKSAERLSTAGDVIVCQTAFEYVSKFEYFWLRLEHKKYLKVLGFTEKWRSIQRHEPDLLKNIPSDSKSSTFGSEDGDEYNASYLRNLNGKAYYLFYKKDSFSLRPLVNQAITNKMDDFLRRFMIPPLMNAIDIDEALEYLTEMRHVVTVFVNTVIKRSLPKFEILSIVNQAYISLCDIVTYHEGVVNKVSYFDKDLMFLVIFGLRGYKHELECQVGLRCAAEIRKSLSGIPNILSVSIGVTSGMTYCGIVGHTLRREYSVISLSVNKAARLMTAYKRKVTCDNETFLSSKMEAKHFHLQPVVQLKGLQNVGPIFEFTEILPPTQLRTPPVLTFPILGRDSFLEACQEKLDFALRLYNKYVEVGELDEERDPICKTCVLLCGETRQGKTRLLNEIFERVFKLKINCVKLTLHITQTRKPYFLISLFLANALNFPHDCTSKLKQMIIFEKLRNFNVNSFLFVLNPIFGIDFPKPPELVISESELKNMRHKVFKLLCQRSYSRFWVVLVDDIEYADDESLEMMDVIFESMFIFSIFAINSRSKLSFDCYNMTVHTRVIKIQLEPIDKIYHKSLACQFLKTLAIPLELEKALHQKSGGNPGWMENYLVSLLQAGEIRIDEIDVNEAHGSGLVFTEAPDIKRILNRQTESALLGTTQNDTSTAPHMEYCYTVQNFKWKLFEMCITDNVENWGAYFENVRTKNKIPVVRLNDSFFDRKFGINVPADTSYLIVYDSLSTFEQLILKCASVLGDKFLRNMLKFIIGSGTERALSIGIKKLFELRIISCGAGNFSKKNVIFQKNAYVEVSEIKCICQSINIDETVADLPKYASCGYSKFKSSEFRTGIYNLLTDRQRKEFHKRALLYLERQSRKCESCGGDFFSQTALFRDYLPKYRFSTELDTYVETLPPRPVVPMRKTQRKINSLIYNYAGYDFRQCECNMILYTLYSQILGHCEGAHLVIKMVEAQVEFANICIKISNIPRAFELLSSAINKLAEYLNMNDENEERDTTLIPYFYGRIFTLQAQCHYHIKQFHRSSNIFYRACAKMGVDFPRTHGAWCLAATSMARKRIKRMLLNDFKPIAIEYEDPLAVLIIEQLSETFSSMMVLYQRMELFHIAKLSAYKGLEMALVYRRDCSSIAVAFSNIMQISFFLGETRQMEWIQHKSLEIVASFQGDIDANRLYAVTKMYSALIICQQVVEIPNRLTIRLGYTVLSIASSIRNISSKWQVIPILVNALIAHKRITETSELLEYVKAKFDKQADKSGITWYYALCMDVQISTGYTIISYRASEQFYFDESENNVFIKDVFALRRFYTNLWLFCVRHEAWETAAIWEQKVKTCFQFQIQDPTVDILTALRVLECLIILWVSAIETRNIISIVNQEREIEKLCQIIKKGLKLTHVHGYQFRLLQLYFKICKSYNVNVLRELDDLKLKFPQTTLMYDMLTHMKKAWSFELTLPILDFWKNHSITNQINWKMFEQSNETYQYSLPLPKTGHF